MISDRNATFEKKIKILVAIVDSEHEVLDRYEEDIGYLDPFELKNLLQNICEGILTEYRRDLLLGYDYMRSIDRLRALPISKEQIEPIEPIASS